MALVMVPCDTEEKSIISSGLSELSEGEKLEVIGELPVIKSPSKSPMKPLVRQGSISDNFFAVKGAALILPRKTNVLATESMQILKKFGGELQAHLRAIFHQLRPQDNIKLAARLESWVETHKRYIVVVSTTGRQDTEESIIVGFDFENEDSTTCTVGLVLPIWCDTNIKLDGDGGFRVEHQERIHTFKPVSVQAMWSALQSLNRCVEIARKYNYYEGSLYLTWIGYYTSKISSDRVYINEWFYREDLSTRQNYFEKIDPERLHVEKLIRDKLKEVMMDMDLDKCTSRQIRKALEGTIDMDLKEYKQYIDTEMLTIVGEMDSSSKILDYLYLGSEWNASNLEELKENGITHILNVTYEIDNFFPNEFKYKCIRLDDVPESNLLPHWNHTWKFIDSAKNSGGKCLVHCKVGKSRSASTVCAYLMKEKMWTRNAALDYIKKRRPIIRPNSGFMEQLNEYEGIVFASAHRHNKLFRSRSENSLVESCSSEDRHNAAGRSPRHPPSAPLIQVQGDDGDMVTIDGADFDLNRHILELTSMSSSKFSRAKSWSPDEGRAPYVPNSNSNEITEQMNSSQASKRRSLYIQSMSDHLPQVLYKGSIDKVANHEHNVSSNIVALQLPCVGESLPQNDAFVVLHGDDNVFSHVSSDNLLSLEKSVSNPSPGGSNSCIDKIPANASLPVVFADTPKISQEVDPTFDITNRCSPGFEGQKTTKNVFVKGHHKTVSLPPPVTQATFYYQSRTAGDDSLVERHPSCSESPSVKSMVTAFESVRIPEEERKIPAAAVRRSISLPIRKQKTGEIDSFSINNFCPITHSNTETEQQTPTVIFGESSAEEKCSSKNSLSFANTNNNNIQPLPSLLKPDESSFEWHKMDKEKKKFSPELLLAIQEVREHISIENDEALCEVTSEIFAPDKNRGVVRRMIREIEKGFRKLTGKSTSKMSGSNTEKNVIKVKCDVDKNLNNFQKIKKVFATGNERDSASVTFPNRHYSECQTFKALTDFVTPAPYRTPNNSRSTSPGAKKFKLSTTCSPVRRSLSERVCSKPQVFKLGSLKFTDNDFSSRSTQNTRNSFDSSHERDNVFTEVTFNLNRPSSLRIRNSSKQSFAALRKSNSLS